MAKTPRVVLPSLLLAVNDPSEFREPISPPTFTVLPWWVTVKLKLQQRLDDAGPGLTPEGDVCPAKTNP